MYSIRLFDIVSYTGPRIGEFGEGRALSISAFKSFLVRESTDGHAERSDSILTVHNISQIPMARVTEPCAPLRIPDTSRPRLDSQARMEILFDSSGTVMCVRGDTVGIP